MINVYNGGSTTPKLVNSPSTQNKFGILKNLINVHPEDSCAEPKCKKRDGPKRHQVPCKFRDKCKFFKTKKCEFDHNISQNMEHKEDITNKLENQVKTLEDKVTFKEMLLMR